MAAAHGISAARAALVAGAAAALLACASDPGGVQFASEGVGLTSVDGLRRVENWGFGLAFVKPGADVTRYDSVFIDGVTIAYKAPSHPARTTRDGIESGTQRKGTGLFMSKDLLVRQVFIGQTGAG